MSHEKEDLDSSESDPYINPNKHMDPQKSKPKLQILDFNQTQPEQNLIQHKKINFTNPLGKKIIFKKDQIKVGNKGLNKSNEQKPVGKPL